MSSLLTENRLVGEAGGAGFKGTPPWFKTKRYFFPLKRCIFHVVSCKKRLLFRILLHLFMQFIFWFVAFGTIIFRRNLKNSTSRCKYQRLLFRKSKDKTASFTHFRLNINTSFMQSHDLLA